MAFLGLAKEPHNAAPANDKEKNMATTETNTANASKPTTYTLLVVFTVDGSSDQNLQDQQAIRDEAASWIESLSATVRGVSVRKAD
jgi:hypothetical protein